jgi:aryl-alcohol dehydrogenase
MAGVIAGCTTIIGIDRNVARLELARELGATHIVDTAEREVPAEIQRITGFGVDFSVETTGVPALLRQAVDCPAPRGTCGVIGAAAMGTEVSLDTNTILVAGRSIRGIVEGDSVPRSLLPRLIALWEQGKFPVDRLMTYYDFDQIDEAARDAEEGKVIKPVLRIGA